MKGRHGVKPVLTSDPASSTTRADEADLFMDAIRLLGTKVTSKESGDQRVPGTTMGAAAKAAPRHAAKVAAAAARKQHTTGVTAEDARLFEDMVAALDGPTVTPGSPVFEPKASVAETPAGWAPIRLTVEIKKDLDGDALRAALEGTEDLDAGPRTDLAPVKAPARPDVIGEKQFRALLDKGRMRVDMDLDLHGMTSPQAIDAVRAFVSECVAAGNRVIRIVHGKGMHSAGEPVLRDLARHLLRHELGDALIVTTTPPSRLGGDGATVCLLKARTAP